MFYEMSKEYIHENLDSLLCQYQGTNSDLLFDSSFEPESFTALEKMQGEKTLFFANISFEEWVGNMLREQFSCVLTNPEDIEKAVQTGIKNFKLILNICGEKHKIYNQETVDVLRRVSIFTLKGQLEDNIDTAYNFNLLAHKILPIVIKKIRQRNYDIEELLKISIVSGLSGLDLKGATAAASSHQNDGIQMKDLMSMDDEQAAEIFLERLTTEYENKNFPIFEINDLIEKINSTNICKMVWMTDDIIESYFDMEVITSLLDKYSINITLVPKNGRYGNDASYEDILKMFSPRLKKYQQLGRLIVLKSGPLMAAANIRKFSIEHTKAIKSANILFLKGCRISEMLNGGINANVYVAYNIVRKVSEKLTGFAAEDNTAVCFHLKPGEYAFWGVKGNDIIFKNERAFLTVKEHFLSEDSIDSLISKFNKIKRLSKNYTENKRPLYQELENIVDMIANRMSIIYDDVADCYDHLERREYSSNEHKKWKNLICKVEENYQSCNGVRLLDVGVGDGKGIKFAYDNGFDIYGCDISDKFINITKNKLPNDYHNRIVKCDMRALSFPDESFEIVRHNASLVHMPIVAKGYGTDKAISEANRVLVKKGLLYISLKIGNSEEICSIDTGEGLGSRIFQLYSQEDIKQLLKQNNFEILSEETIIENRNLVQSIEWYNVIAQKK